MGSNMTSTKRLSTSGSCIAALLLGITAVLYSAAAAAEDEVPANTLRVGMYFVKYNASAGNLTGPFTPPGINLRVDHVNTPYFAYLRRLSASWEFELAAGVPPKTHTRGVGPATLGSVPFNGQEVATAKWFSPTVLLEYKFLPETSAFRPYVGAGFNYTHFYERDSTAAGDAANGGPTRTYLSDSFGPAASAPSRPRERDDREVARRLRNVMIGSITEYFRRFCRRPARSRCRPVEPAFRGISGRWRC